MIQNQVRKLSIKIVDAARMFAIKHKKHLWKKTTTPWGQRRINIRVSLKIRIWVRGQGLREF
jgi:hypothetical protein